MWDAVWQCLEDIRCACCDESLEGGYEQGPLCAECFAVCEPCPAHGDSLPLGAPPCHSAFAYHGPLSEAVLRLKWRGRDDLAEPLGKLMMPLVTQQMDEHDVLVPVPLHPSRLRQRGYNQATLLAKAALPNRSARRRIQPFALAARKPSLPARHVDRAERLLRVQRQFTVPKAAASELRGLRVLLLDDVITTGATVTACAEALREVGVSHVSAVSLLRVTRS